MTQRITIVIESLRGGGAQQVATALANMWADRGDIVTVITFLRAESDVFSLDPRVRRISIGGAQKSRNAVSALFANFKRVWRLRAAIISSQSQSVISFVGSTNILTILATRVTGVRVCIAERNDLGRQSLATPWEFLRRHTYKSADLITANSKHTVRQLNVTFPNKDICWTPNPIRASGYGQELKNDKPYIVAAGRLHRQKGFDILLRAFAQFRNSHPQVELLILGEGDERVKLESLIRSLHLEPSVNLMGFVKDPFPYYRGAVFLAHPARYEGLPNVVLEVMSTGVPVVVTDTQPGILDFVKHEKTGLVVPGESVRCLTAAMRRLCDDATLRAQLGNAAREAIRPCLPGQAIKTWDTVIQKLDSSG